MHTSPPSWISLLPSSHPSRSTQSTKLSALCYTAGSYWLAISHVVVYIGQPQFSTPPPAPYLHAHSLPLCLYRILQISSSVLIFRVHIYTLVCNICFPLSDLLHSVWQTLGPSSSQHRTRLSSFLWLSNSPLHICTTSSLSIHLLMDI